MTKKTTGLTPGTKAPESGQYKNSKSPLTESTAVKGKSLPPGPAGGKWTLVDKTKHKK